MGTIKKVMYEEIPVEECSVKEASEYYWYQNVLGLHPSFTEGNERYELEQVSIRAKAFKKYMDEHPGEYPKTNTALWGASALHDNVILVAEL